MATRMLIDAAHPEETRIVVMKGKRLEEFDFEVESRKPLKGNIYLAKVARVEPSLQAAFVEFGGNRHGFLSFNEIHPDYYQIPIADREALLAEQQQEAVRAAEEEEAEIASADTPDGDEEDGGEKPRRNRRGQARTRRTAEDDSPGSVENVGGDEIEEEAARRASPSSRPYKIQEVIKRRQILLVQAVKEERGTKGAALTTYLSLPGRYCVLMPNTARGGGISRKIANTTDRRKLKSVVTDLEVPKGAGVIVRTAGAKRTKLEIRRDFEYLLRLWDDIRDLTLKSSAPMLVYEEASLITRTIRDLYSKDIDEVLIEGDEGYRIAKDFMKRIMPSHAKKVQPYKDRIPLLHRFQIEPQLDTMYSSQVTLPSGGYIVIDTAEALVAIDVNSGKATKGRSVEETAYKTNLEAAEEVARQLRLRDLAGLIVIDFIDMDEARNNRAVERKLKENMRVDRARIQMGRISHFGLLEMSRQRLRPGVQDINMKPCEHCGGVGRVRSVDSATLHILRAIEEEGIRKRATEIAVHMPTDIAIYLVNNKREMLADIEARYGFRVRIAVDKTLIDTDFRIDRLTGADTASDGESGSDIPTAGAARQEEETESESGGGRKRRRRRGGGGSENRADDEDASPAEAGETRQAGAEGAPEEGEPRRRRGKRGGRRRRSRGGESDASGAANPFPAAAAAPNRPHDEAAGGDNIANMAQPETPDDAFAPGTGFPANAGEQPAPQATAAEAPDDAFAPGAGFPANAGEQPAPQAAVAEAPAETPTEAPAPAEAEIKVEPESGPVHQETPEPVGAESEAAAPTKRGWWRRR